MVAALQYSLGTTGTEPQIINWFPDTDQDVWAGCLLCYAFQGLTPAEAQNH